MGFLSSEFGATRCNGVLFSNYFCSFLWQHHILQTSWFAHTSNSYLQRRTLWADILSLGNTSLCIQGDFNVVLGSHERSQGSMIQNRSTQDFQEMVNDVDLFDIEPLGSPYTWYTRRGSQARLDRVLADHVFQDSWNEVKLINLPCISSDHHPIRLQLV